MNGPLFTLAYQIFIDCNDCVSITKSNFFKTNPPTQKVKDAQIVSAQENTENLEAPDQDNLESDKEEEDTGTAEKAESENISDSDEVKILFFHYY